MADRVLRGRYVQVRVTARRIDQTPTRTIVEFSDGSTHPVPDDDVIQSGRLVDREAIWDEIQCERCSQYTPIPAAALEGV